MKKKFRTRWTAIAIGAILAGALAAGTTDAAKAKEPVNTVLMALFVIALPWLLLANAVNKLGSKSGSTHTPQSHRDLNPGEIGHR